jgi:hypothetical protein
MPGGLNDSAVDVVEFAVLLLDRRLNTELRLLECDTSLCSDICIDPWVGASKHWVFWGSEVEASDGGLVAGKSTDGPERDASLLSYVNILKGLGMMPGGVGQCLMSVCRGPRLGRQIQWISPPSR